MRNVTRCSLLLLLLQACQQKPAETTTPPLPAAAVSTATELTVAQRFSPIISGYWVSADYLKEVARTRSPEASFDHTPPGPSSLAISPFASQKDSVEIGASYSLHEGGSLILLLRSTAQAGTLQLRAPYSNNDGTTDELAYQITATDTTLFFITRNSKTHQIVSKVDYHRTGIPGKEPDLEAGVEWGVNDLLVTGQYNGIDSLNQPVHAQFLTSGLIKGLPFRKYSIQNDFTGPNPGNAIYFDVYTKQQQQVAASFGRDTLKLYTIHSVVGVPLGETDTTEIFTRGRLRYQLVRVKKP